MENIESAVTVAEFEEVIETALTCKIKLTKTLVFATGQDKGGELYKASITIDEADNKLDKQSTAFEIIHQHKAELLEKLSKENENMLKSVRKSLDKHTDVRPLETDHKI